MFIYQTHEWFIIKPITVFTMCLVEQTFFYSKYYQSQSENLTYIIILAITCVLAACGNTWSREVRRLQAVSLLLENLLGRTQNNTSVCSSPLVQYVTLAVMLPCLFVLR